MSWAKIKAAQINVDEEQACVLRQNASIAKDVVAASADALWNRVGLEVESIARELCEELPLAKKCGLRAERLNSNNITISTRGSPLLRMEIIYYSKTGIGGTIRKAYTSWDSWRVANLSMIRFAVDSQMQPWFSDGSRYLHPEQVAEELMEEVVQFLGDASKRPYIVG